MKEKNVKKCKLTGGGANSKSIKKTLPVILLLLLITIIIGVTYAAYLVTLQSSENSITTGLVSMSYTESTNVITIENALPMSDADGKNQEDYFDFSVTSNITLNENDEDYIVTYGITLEPLSTNTLEDKNIKIFLEDVTGSTSKTLVDSKLISNLSNYKLYSTFHTHKYNKNSITTKYRLRAWIDYYVDSSDWDSNNQYEYKFKVNINTEESKALLSYPEGTINYAMQNQVQKTAINYKYTNDANVTEYTMNENPTTEQINSCVTSLVNSDLGLDNDSAQTLCTGGFVDDISLIDALTMGYLDYDIIADTGVVSQGDTVYNVNDNGVFLYNGTDDNNGDYPIYYYRGNVDNNNVLFANMCWKIVRTTSTGGTKLIYNGLPDENGACNNTGEDSSAFTSKFNENYISPADVGYMYGERYEYGELDLKWYSLARKSTTYQSVSSSTTLGGGKTVTYSNGTYTITDYSTIDYSTYKSNNSSYKGYYMCADYSSSCSTIRYIENPYSSYYYYVSMSNGETYTSLMNNEVATKKAEIATYKYGNDVTYSNGTYTLVNTVQKSIITEKEDIANGYHYTCFTSGTTCSSVYYITYFEDSTYIYYLTFTNGDNLDTAKEKMFTNTNDSTIKTNIDNWYSTNLTSYTNILENTIFCNDRTYSNGFTYQGQTFNGGAMYSKDTNPNDVSYHTSFVNALNGTPSLQCSNINDRFSLSTTNGGTSGYGNNKLIYSVGLLTYDEINLAGATLYDGSTTFNHYLNDGYVSWLFSPVDWGRVVALSGLLYEGGLLNDWVDNSAGVRPVVSLQLGTQFKAGTTGVASNPYVVE